MQNNCKGNAFLQRDIAKNSFSKTSTQIQPIPLQYTQVKLSSRIFVVTMLAGWILFPLAGQFLSTEHIPRIRWMLRETEYFQIIHTTTLSGEAAFLSMILDEIMETINADLPSKRPPKKWPLLLSDVGMTANGFVTILPRRSIWYSTPIDDKYYSSMDWFLALARHEGRHMGHFDMADRGVTHLLKTLFGEIGLGLGIGIGYPGWYLEGDSIYTETIYSLEGRGRDPLFLQDMALIALEKPDIGYARIVNESFGKYHPNVYKLGYELIRWMRKVYGDESIYLYAAESPTIPIPLLAVDRGMKKATKLLPRQVFSRMLADLRKETTEFKRANEWSPAVLIDESKSIYTMYSNLYVDRKNNVFANRTNANEGRTLVSIQPDGKESVWMRLPSAIGGGASVRHLSNKRKDIYRILWASYRYNPLATSASVLDVTVTDLDASGRQIRRFHPLTGTRLTQPVLSPDGSRFSATEYPRGGANRIVVVDVETGKILHQIEMESHATVSQTSWSESGTKLVFVLRRSLNRQLMEWTVGSKTIKSIAPPTRNFIKFPVYAPDESEVIFSSNTAGVESIWATSTITGEMRNIVRRWYSATDPAISPDGRWLYFAEYSSTMGERLARIERTARISPLIASPSAISQIENRAREPLPDSVILNNPEKRSLLAGTGEKEHPPTPFDPLFNGMKIHTWGILPDISNPENIGLFLMGTNLLGTLNMQFGALYNPGENSTGGTAHFSIHAMRPIITFESTYFRRYLFNNPYHQVNGGIALSFPMKLSRNGVWHHLISPKVGMDAVWSEKTESTKMLLQYGFLWYNLRHAGQRAFRPEMGWSMNGNYEHYPSNGANMLSIDVKMHFPGGFRSTFLTLRGAAERQTQDGDFQSRIGTARGYSWPKPKFIAKISLDYEFPLFYPDLPLGSLIYVQRFRLGLHSDFAWIDPANILTESTNMDRQWSTGTTLTLDFASLNLPPTLSIGFRLDWLWQEQKFVFNVDLLTSLPQITSTNSAF